MAGKVVNARNELERIRCEVSKQASLLQKISEEIKESERTSNDFNTQVRQAKKDIKKTKEEMSLIESNIEKKGKEFTSLNESLVRVKEQKKAIESDIVILTQNKEDSLLYLGKTSDLKDKESKKLSGLKIMRSSMDKEIVGLDAEIAVRQSKLKRVTVDLLGEEKRLEDVSSRIKESVDSFRLYEKRIGSLSRQTGFLIEYDNLKEYGNKK